jgi:uncharacterized LabA/DUF88 family protein
LRIPSTKPRTYAYIDGFNLYYGCYGPRAPREWSKYKWIDLEKFCDTLFPDNDVVAIRYYTADVSNRPPDGKQNDRQQVYLKALSTLSRVSIIKGHFLGPRKRRMPQCDQHGTPLGKKVWVLRTEEKGSDVNLAVDLLHDCVNGYYDCAVVVSNDSDLARSIGIVRSQYDKTIGIANPHASHQTMSGALRKLKHFDKRISSKILASSQFPEEVPIGSGVIRRPAAWR